MSTIQTSASETELPLVLTVSQPGTGGLAGLSPTVALRRIAPPVSPASYLDWADGTFKTGGWTTKYASMDDVERGHYQRLLDVSALGVVAGDTLGAEYHVDDGGLVKGESADLIFVVDEVASDVALLRKSLTNRMEEAGGNPGTLVLYDDDDATPLLEWELRDEYGGAVVSTPGTPARRSKAT